MITGDETATGERRETVRRRFMIMGDNIANGDRGAVRRPFMIMGDRRATVRRRFTIMGDESADGERRETVEELLDLLAVVQKMGRRLAYETHGDSYEFVRELNEQLHQARAKIELIQQMMITVR